MHNAVLDTHILSIIQKNQVSEQSELHKILCEHGYDVPQATISRRLKKLKNSKSGRSV